MQDASFRRTRDIQDIVIAQLNMSVPSILRPNLQPTSPKRSHRRAVSFQKRYLESKGWKGIRVATGLYLWARDSPRIQKERASPARTHVRKEKGRPNKNLQPFDSGHQNTRQQNRQRTLGQSPQSRRCCFRPKLIDPLGKNWATLSTGVLQQ